MRTGTSFLFSHINYSGAGEVATVSTAPDSSTVTNLTTNGLMQSSTHSVPGATTYTYDPHNRTKSVTVKLGKSGLPLM